MHVRVPKRVEESKLADLVMMVCAVLVALAGGVLAAYGVCLVFFAAFKMRAQQVKAEKPGPVAAAPSVVQS